VIAGALGPAGDPGSPGVRGATGEVRTGLSATMIYIAAVYKLTSLCSSNVMMTAPFDHFLAMTV